MRVLLVEDEERLAENVAAAVREMLGFAVDCAADGQLGWSLAENRCYDLIVLDLMLPLLMVKDVLRKRPRRSSAAPQSTKAPRERSGSAPASHRRQPAGITSSNPPRRLP